MKRLLVAVDDDPQAKKVIETARALALALGARLTVCHFMPEEVYREIEERQMREQVEHPLGFTEAGERAGQLAAELAAGLKGSGVVVETRGAVGEPAEGIVALADELDADLIVMGFEGLRGLEKLRALGSVSRAVMEMSTRPVLIVPDEA